MANIGKAKNDYVRRSMCQTQESIIPFNSHLTKFYIIQVKGLLLNKKPQLLGMAYLWSYHIN